MPINVSVTNNHIPALVKSLPGLLKAILKKSAFDAERGAKEAAPVDTGALRASIYVSLMGESNYNAAQSDAAALGSPGKNSKGRSPHKRVEILAEVTPDDDMTAIVAVAAVHGAFVEYGTERQAAKPFLAPAIDRVRKGFTAAVKQALKRASEG